MAAGLETKKWMHLEVLGRTDHTMRGPAGNRYFRLRPHFPFFEIVPSRHPFALIYGSFRPTRAAVKAERSEFILSLDGGSGWPHPKFSGRRDAELSFSLCVTVDVGLSHFTIRLMLRVRLHGPQPRCLHWFWVQMDFRFYRPPSSTPPFSAPRPGLPDCGSHALARADAPLQAAR